MMNGRERQEPSPVCWKNHDTVRVKLGEMSVIARALGGHKNEAPHATRLLLSFSAC